MTLKEFILKKLSEPSTYAALAAILAATGLITAEQQAQFGVALPVIAQQVSLVVSGVCTLVGVVLNEGK